MTTPTDRARDAAVRIVGHWFANGPRHLEAAYRESTAGRLVDAIAQLIRDTEAEVRGECAKIADVYEAGREAAAADAKRDHQHDEWCQYRGEAQVCRDIAAAIREAKP